MEEQESKEQVSDFADESINFEDWECDQAIAFHSSNSFSFTWSYQLLCTHATACCKQVLRNYWFKITDSKVFWIMLTLVRKVNSSRTEVKEFRTSNIRLIIKLHRVRKSWTSFLLLSNTNFSVAFPEGFTFLMRVWAQFKTLLIQRCFDHKSD